MAHRSVITETVLSSWLSTNTLRVRRVDHDTDRDTADGNGNRSVTGNWMCTAPLQVATVDDVHQARLVAELVRPSAVTYTVWVR